LFSVAETVFSFRLGKFITQLSISRAVRNYGEAWGRQADICTSDRHCALHLDLLLAHAFLSFDGTFFQPPHLLGNF
jgi:hypothetical protein